MQKTPIPALIVILFLMIPVSGWSAESPRSATTQLAVTAAVDDLASTLEPIRSNNNLPALGAAVWRGAELRAIGVVGAREQGGSAPATTEDQWHLGSDTKAMTATLVGLYVDRGVIRFEDTLGNLFAGESLHPGYADVSIEQLLQHRGGAPANIPSDTFAQMRVDGLAPGARATAVRALLARGPAQSPGTYVYSNSGYIIAAAALERVLGEPWEVTIQRELFGTLGMDSCGFGAPTGEQPRGHRINEGQPVAISPGPQADNPPSLGPAGTVRCSLADWGKFLAVHLAGARGEATILTPQSMGRLHAPPDGGDYMGGWLVVSQSWTGGPALTHGGSNTYWYVTTWLVPAKNAIFAVVTNRGDDVAFKAINSVIAPLNSRYAAQ